MLVFSLHIPVIYTENLIGGVCGTDEERENGYGVVVGKIDTDDGFVNLGLNGRNLQGIRWKVGDWIHLAQDSDN